MALPESVIIVDDTMREGLQIEDADIPVSEKLRLLDALGETGAKKISIGSFACYSFCGLEGGEVSHITVSGICFWTFGLWDFRTLGLWDFWALGLWNFWTSGSF